MKRAFAVIAAFAAVALLTVAAQAESNGEQIFNQKCAMCHKIKGKGGAIGPELTGIAARMNEKQIRAKLENPKQSTAMPSFKSLPKADVKALLDYLKSVK